MKINRRGFLFLLLAVCVAFWLFLVWLERSYRVEGENYSLIEEGLYMGGDVAEPPPGTGAVVNLCHNPDPYQVDVSLWEPIPDNHRAPSIDWLRLMVKFVDSQRQAGITTFVHCRNGVSRSGMVVTAYVMYKNRWSRDKALAFVRSKRPIARPNRAFMRRLLQWERAMKEPERQATKR
jgi:hypothetical protein